MDQKNRVSVRDFDVTKRLNDEQRASLIEVINNSPTSTNDQQFSALILESEASKDWMSDKNWGQQHIKDSAGVIVFFADRTRVEWAMEGVEVNEATKYHEIMRSATDATIAATYTQDYLVSQGLGTCFIGGILAFAEEFNEHFEIPDTMFPVVALTFGWATKLNDFKPKMNKVFLEKYDAELETQRANEYEEVVTEYYNSRNIDKKGFKKAIQNTQTAGTYINCAFEDGSDNVKRWMDKFK